MSYQVDGGPKIIFGTIAIVVLAFFGLVAAYAVVPYYYEKYQSHKLRQCEDMHAVAEDAWMPIFGFDIGGRYLVGDNSENRALIKCIVDSQSVRYRSEPLYADHGLAHSSLSLWFGAFDHGLSFEYYEGALPAKSSQD